MTGPTWWHTGHRSGEYRSCLARHHAPAAQNTSSKTKVMLSHASKRFQPKRNVLDTLKACPWSVLIETVGGPFCLMKIYGSNIAQYNHGPWDTKTRASRYQTCAGIQTVDIKQKGRHKHRYFGTPPWIWTSRLGIKHIETDLAVAHNISAHYFKSPFVANVFRCNALLCIPWCCIRFQQCITIDDVSLPRTAFQQYVTCTYHDIPGFWFKSAERWHLLLQLREPLSKGIQGSLLCLGATS